MIKYLKTTLVITALLVLNLGCSTWFNCKSPEERKIDEARKLILTNQAECVLISGGEIFAQTKGMGVSPLLTIYEKMPEEMENGIVVDKVIGRAAAAIIINGKAKRVYALLISEDGKEFLETHGIEVEYDKIVPRILNKNRDGLCPLEASVLGEEDSTKALEKLKAKIESFKK